MSGARPQLLSEHFKLREFHCRDGTPVPGHKIGELRELCQRYLEPLRAHFGRVDILSGYRTEAHNARVAGAPASMHLYRLSVPGVAADVKCATGSARDWYRYLDAAGPGGLGLYTGFVHVDTRRGRARW